MTLLRRATACRLGAAAALCLAAGLAGPLPGWAAEPPVPTITVEGEATADVVPDTADLTVGVETERPTAALATADLATAGQAMVEAAKAEGIEAKDIRSTALQLFAVYPPDVPGQPSAQARPPRAFHAGTSFRITVRPAERAGALASRLVQKGANTLEGIDYSFSQEAAKLDALRAEAMRDARRKAEIYVDALGLRLGQVIEITPDGAGGMPRPMMMRAGAAPKAADSLAAAPGTLSLRAGVSVRWVIAGP